MPAQANSSGDLVSINSFVRWHTSVIPVSWEAQMRPNMVPGQPRQKSCEDPSQQKKDGHGDGGKLKVGGLWSLFPWAKSNLAPK